MVVLLPLWGGEWKGMSEPFAGLPNSGLNEGFVYDLHSINTQILKLAKTVCFLIALYWNLHQLS